MITSGGEDIAAVIPIGDLELLEALENYQEAVDEIEEARERNDLVPSEQLWAEEDFGRFYSRSVSIVRYRVRGETVGSFWDSVDEGVKKGAFREIDNSGNGVGMGWVSMEDFTDRDFKGTSYLRRNYVALSLRVDTIHVPPRILEMQVRKESAKLLEETGRQRLSSAQHRELKERLKETLKRQAFPSIQVFDLVWDTSKAVAYFGSHSVKARDRVEGHFKKCFGLTLVPLIPYIRAAELLQEKSRQKVLEKLKPCVMAP